MPNSIAYKLLEACRQKGCPICSVEQKGVARYLDNHFYENVNSPAWRDRLRGSLGFCHEHAWLGVNQRLGDALGYAIIYHDIVNAILGELGEETSPAPAPRRTSLFGQVTEQGRNLLEKMSSAFSVRKRCPVCEQRDELTRTTLAVLVEELEKEEMADALRSSEGICLPHMKQALEYVKNDAVAYKLFSIQREKLAGLHAELAEFIRKNDYQLIEQGFGKEGDAWLRAISLVTGSRRKT